MLKYYGAGERSMHFNNILCKIEWENKYTFESDMETHEFTSFGVTSSWLVKMCLIYTMGQI